VKYGYRAWFDAHNFINYTLAGSESLKLADAVAKSSSVVKNEALAFAESRNTLIGLNPKETLRFTEATSNVVSFDRKFNETLAISDTNSKAITKPLAESFRMVDANTSLYGLNLSEVFEVTEKTRVFSFDKNLDETLTIGDSGGKVFGKQLAESFGFVERINKTVGLNKGETLKIADSVKNGVTYIRKFAETLKLAESVAKTYKLNKAEAFAIAESIRRPGDLVISDTMLASGDVTMKDFVAFMHYGNVPGYEKWRDFIPGDYEYREAMFRVVLESKNDDRGLLTNLQATIDVPDLIDRGSATIANAAYGITVVYNRHFHIVPEITLAARGGTGGNPVAVEFNGVPTKDSFSVRLRDTVTGAFVTGAFTWAAHGY